MTAQVGNPSQIVVFFIAGAWWIPVIVGWWLFDLIIWWIQNFGLFTAVVNDG